MVPSDVEWFISISVIRMISFSPTEGCLIAERNETNFTPMHPFSDKEIKKKSSGNWIISPNEEVEFLSFWNGISHRTPSECLSPNWHVPWLSEFFLSFWLCLNHHCRYFHLFHSNSDYHYEYDYILSEKPI